MTSQPVRLDPATDDCGRTCPCWRLLSRPDLCRPGLDGSPYSLEILRNSPVPTNAVLDVRCVALAYPWGSPELADFADELQCR